MSSTSPRFYMGFFSVYVFVFVCLFLFFFLVFFFLIIINPLKSEVIKFI